MKTKGVEPGKARPVTRESPGNPGKYPPKPRNPDQPELRNWTLFLKAQPYRLPEI